MLKSVEDVKQIVREVKRYIDDAKRADFFSTLEYVASHPAASRCLNVVFNVPMSERIDTWDILEKADLRNMPDASKCPAQKDLDMLVLLGALDKSKSMYLPFYSITLEGHDVCVTYQNLLDEARKGGCTKDMAGKLVYDWVCSASVS